MRAVEKRASLRQLLATQEALASTRSVVSSLGEILGERAPLADALAAKLVAVIDEAFAELALVTPDAEARTDVQKAADVAAGKVTP